MLFLDGSKHTIAEIPCCSVVPFAVTVVFTVLPYPAGLWNDPLFRRIYLCGSHPNLERVHEIVCGLQKYGSPFVICFQAGRRVG